MVRSMDVQLDTTSSPEWDIAHITLNALLSYLIRKLSYMHLFFPQRLFMKLINMPQEQ